MQIAAGVASESRFSAAGRLGSTSVTFVHYFMGVLPPGPRSGHFELNKVLLTLVFVLCGINLGGFCRNNFAGKEGSRTRARLP